MELKTGNQEKINETKTLLFETINKINRSLGRLTKKKKEHKLLISEIKERTVDPTNIKRIIKEYYECIYAHKFNNLGEMDQLLQRCNVPTLTRNKPSA